MKQIPKLVYHIFTCIANSFFHFSHNSKNVGINIFYTWRNTAGLNGYLSRTSFTHLYGSRRTLASRTPWNSLHIELSRTTMSSHSSPTYLYVLAPIILPRTLAVRTELLYDFVFYCLVWSVC